MNCGKGKVERQALHNALYFISWCKGADWILIDRAAWDRGWNNRRIEQWYNNDSKKVRKRMRKSIRLATMLAYIRNCDTTMAHDHIHSVLGLVNDADLAGAPDYKISVSELSTNLVQSFVEKYGSLDIICFAHTFRPLPDAKRDMPSWVPDWTIKNIETEVTPLMASQASKRHIGNFRPKHSLDFTHSFQATGKSNQEKRRGT